MEQTIDYFNVDDDFNLEHDEDHYSEFNFDEGEVESDKCDFNKENKTGGKK